MTLSLRHTLFLLSPAAWAGPILGKELRVSSRRRRNYSTRCLYVILLLVFVAVVWAREIIMTHNSSLGVADRVAWQIATYAAAAKAVTVTICVFQFWVVHALAVIMLSTSVSDEIVKRTLGVLMTTPITPGQIVLGKLAGKFLQLILLVALNLPVLAMIRVFGGIPWDYLVSSTCITLTTGFFSGCISLYFSIGTRRAYLAIMRTVFVLGTLFFFLPVMGGVFFRKSIIHDPQIATLLYTVLEYINPYVAITEVTRQVYATTGSTYFLWHVHCLAMVWASLVVILAATMRLRRVAMNEACGISPSLRRWRLFGSRAAAGVEQPADPSRIRRVKGSPVFWKELAGPLIQNTSRRKNFIAGAAAVLCLVITYWANHSDRGLRQQFVQTFYIVLFVVAWAALQAVISATAITVEKETRSWPILLVTPLSSRRIVRDKVLASLLRTSPVWVFLVLHTLYFVSRRYIHPISLLHIPMLALPVVVLLACSGLYFSSLFTKTTTAVAANLAFAAVIWVVIPTVWTIYCGIGSARAVSAQVLTSLNPVVTTFVVLSGETGWRATSPLGNLDYSWTFNAFYRVGPTTWFILAIGVAYLTIAMLFIWLAQARLRKDIFTD